MVIWPLTLGDKKGERHAGVDFVSLEGIQMLVDAAFDVTTIGGTDPTPARSTSFASYVSAKR